MDLCSVESGAYDWSPESVASLVRIVSACSRHHILFTLKVFLPCTDVVLDRVLSVIRLPVFFSQWVSGNQAVGVVASANHMFTNSNRLIVVDQMVFNSQC